MELCTCEGLLYYQAIGFCVPVNTMFGHVQPAIASMYVFAGDFVVKTVAEVEVVAVAVAQSLEGRGRGVR